jgi:hypothetical protein
VEGRKEDGVRMGRWVARAGRAGASTGAEHALSRRGRRREACRSVPVRREWRGRASRSHHRVASGHWALALRLALGRLLLDLAPRRLGLAGGRLAARLALSVRALGLDGRLRLGAVLRNQAGEGLVAQALLVRALGDHATAIQDHDAVRLGAVLELVGHQQPCLGLHGGEGEEQCDWVRRRWPLGVSCKEHLRCPLRSSLQPPSHLRTHTH